MATKAVRLCTQVPVQVASAVLMLLSAGWAEARLNAADIWAVTALFFFLVLLAATQDIAVDGWALTLLSRHNIGCDSILATRRGSVRRLRSCRSSRRTCCCCARPALSRLLHCTNYQGSATRMAYACLNILGVCPSCHRSGTRFEAYTI